MRYFVIDTAGRWWCGNDKGFDSYDHNQAYRFPSMAEAQQFADRHKGARVEIL